MKPLKKTPTWQVRGSMRLRCGSERGTDDTTLVWEVV